MANSTPSRTARVADLFLSRPNTWISSDELSSVGGRCGWRTRISDARRQFGLAIENRVKRDGHYAISEYRLSVPVAELAQ